MYYASPQRYYRLIDRHIGGKIESLPRKLGDSVFRNTPSLGSKTMGQITRKWSKSKGPLVWSWLKWSKIQCWSKKHTYICSLSHRMSFHDIIWHLMTSHVIWEHQMSEIILIYMFHIWLVYFIVSCILSVNFQICLKL